MASLEQHSSHLIHWWLEYGHGNQSWFNREDIENQERLLGREWKWLGEGSYRTCYLRNNVVYKLDIDLGEGANESEYNNWKRICELEPFSWCDRKWLVPKMRFFKFPKLGSYGRPGYKYNPSVIAMPLYRGEDWEECEDGCGGTSSYHCLEYTAVCEYFDLHDLTDCNVAVQPDGTRIMLDLGC